MEEEGTIYFKIVSETELLYLSRLDTAILQRNSLGISIALKALQNGSYRIPLNARKFLRATGWTETAFSQSHVATANWVNQEE